MNFHTCYVFHGSGKIMRSVWHGVPDKTSERAELYVNDRERVDPKNAVKSNIDPQAFPATLECLKEPQSGAGIFCIESYNGILNAIFLVLVGKDQDVENRYCHEWQCRASGHLPIPAMEISVRPFIYGILYNPKGRPSDWDRMVVDFMPFINSVGYGIIQGMQRVA